MQNTRIFSIFLLTITIIHVPLAHAQAFSIPYRDFIAACIHAFAQSSQMGGEMPTHEHLEFGKSLCECTAQESGNQHVPIARLQSETAKIKADPKYKLHDPGLLASLQYCSMKATEGLDPNEK